MNIIFRVDASLQMGTGHVMRCLTFAQTLKENNASVEFICRKHEGNLIDKIHSSGFNVHELEVLEGFEVDNKLAHSHWLGATQKQDADDCIDIFKKEKIDWLIVDHYALDVRWESLLRTCTKRIMVIDDLADRLHNCDLLLDQNLIANMGNRYNKLVTSDCIKLIGPKYALLQPQYSELNPSPPRLGLVQTVLVYFGGADDNNLTGRVISAFLSLNKIDIKLDVVINPFSIYANSIRKQVQDINNITLYESIPSLALLMMKADLAVGAAGATSWERCCLGLPSIVITIANNQIAIAEELNKKRLIKWIGNHDMVDDHLITMELKNAFETEWIESYSSRCLEVCDGRGLQRVTDIISLHADSDLIIRNASINDKDFLLNLANSSHDTQSINNENLFTAKEFDWSFFKQLRNNDYYRIYIVETLGGLPVGQVFFELTELGWEINFTIASYACGKGIEKNILHKAITFFRKSICGPVVFNRIKKDINELSIIFQELPKLLENSIQTAYEISICSDRDSWINKYISQLLLGWLVAGHHCVWVHSSNNLPGGDFCFYLSYSRIVDQLTREKYGHNLVVHESELPKGKGWSPLTWQILEGHNRIPVSLIEAAENVDSGVIYAQRWIEFEGHELIDELREKQACTTFDLCRWFVSEYPKSIIKAQQSGKESFYPQRRPVDSELDPEKNFEEQFNLLRVVDNERYPAFFIANGNTYLFHIIKIKDGI